MALTEPLTPAEQRGKFHLPAGYEIQLVAAEPEIQKPMNLAFDARGRLWVTHSVEYPFAPPPDAARRDGLTVLSDFGPDGRARRASRFAADLSIPLGVLPLADPGDGTTSVVVWSIPHNWKLTDTDGDMVADTRDLLYGPFDFVDTHGDQSSFRMGLDGWVYACHGFRSRHQRRPGGAWGLHRDRGQHGPRVDGQAERRPGKVLRVPIRGTVHGGRRHPVSGRNRLQDRRGRGARRHDHGTLGQNALTAPRDGVVQRSTMGRSPPTTRRVRR
ncbi:MAG: hypothetical protein ACKOCN_04815 [Planctomycetaceae bacterium]